MYTIQNCPDMGIRSLGSLEILSSISFICRLFFFSGSGSDRPHPPPPQSRGLDLCIGQKMFHPRGSPAVCIVPFFTAGSTY